MSIVYNNILTCLKSCIAIVVLKYDMFIEIIIVYTFIQKNWLKIQKKKKKPFEQLKFYEN